MEKIKHIPLSELVVSITSGLNPRNNFSLNFNNTGYFYINIKNLTLLDEPFLANQDEMALYNITKETKNLINKKSKLENGDILFPAFYSEKMHIVALDNGASHMDISENVYAIKPKNEINKKWLLYMLKTEFVTSQIEKLTEGKTLKRIQKSDLSNLLIPVFPEPIQEKYINILAALYEYRKSCLSLEHWISNAIKNIQNYVQDNNDISEKVETLNEFDEETKNTGLYIQEALECICRANYMLSEKIKEGDME